jgi:hypothetical protein
VALAMIGGGSSIAESFSASKEMTLKTAGGSV